MNRRRGRERRRGVRGFIFMIGGRQWRCVRGRERKGGLSLRVVRLRVGMVTDLFVLAGIVSGHLDIG